MPVELATVVPDLSPTQWQRVDDLLAGALARPPAERPDFLRSAGATDPEDTRLAAALLGLEPAVPAFLEAPAVEHALPFLDGPQEEPDLAPGVGARIGAYRLIKQIGRGGMSVVYLAERDDQSFRKQVAVKLIPDHLGDARFLARFQAEREILAGLEHPAIARILDGGESERGLPYLVMEYVEGEPVDAYCDRHRLTVEQRLEVFIKIAEAVAHAHQNLVVHRDLKPGNILVTAKGEVKLLDFGIAKVLAADEARLTLTGERLLTPAYASPEQLRGHPARTTSDVYSLGVLLYELLTGGLPYGAPAFPHELARAILEEPAPRPSAAASLGSAAASRATDAKRLRRRLRGDLDTIVLKALRQEPERRYRSLDALLDDVRRHLSAQPVAARGDRWTYRLGKFGRRRWPALATLAAFVLVAGGLSGFYALRIRGERDAARREAAKAKAVTGFLTELFEASDPVLAPEARADRLTARMLLERSSKRIHSELADQPEVRAELLDALGDIHSHLDQLQEAETVLMEALTLKRRIYGPRHEEVAKTLELLTDVVGSKGQLERAEAFGRECLDIRREHLGADSPGLAKILYLLGDILQWRYQHEESERLLQDALRASRRTHPGDHQEVAAILDSLGIAQFDRDQLDHAEDNLRQALAMRRRLFGDKHPHVASNLVNLARVLKAKGDLVGAESLHRKALAISRQIFGDNHSAVGMAMNNLAQLLEERGQLAEAEALFTSAVPILRQGLGQEDVCVQGVVQRLGAVRLRQGDARGSEQVLLEELPIMRRAKGDAGPQVAAVLELLGQAALLDGRPAQAAARCREALRARSEGDPDRAYALVGLGWALLETRRAAEAEPFLQEAVRLAPQAKSKPALTGISTGTLTALAQGGLGRCLMARGRYGEAGPLLAEALATLRVALPRGEFYLARLRPAGEKAAAYLPPKR
jgi:eukaryotic-like serine/threonine-protein kinase